MSHHATKNKNNCDKILNSTKTKCNITPNFIWLISTRDLIIFEKNRWIPMAFRCSNGDKLCFNYELINELWL